MLLFEGSVVENNGINVILLHLVKGEDLPEDVYPSSRRFDWFRVLKTLSNGSVDLGWLRADCNVKVLT